MTTTTTATVKETAAALRKALRTAFPDTRCTVRMARGTAYGWLDVSWTDGPTEQQVGQIASEFQDQKFTGSDDLYHSTGVTGWSCCGLAYHRTISPALVEQARQLVERTVDGEPFIRHPRTGRTYCTDVPGDYGVEVIIQSYLREVAG